MLQMNNQNLDHKIKKLFSGKNRRLKKLLEKREEKKSCLRQSQINILISQFKNENMKYAYDYYCPSSNFRSLMVIKISSFSGSVLLLVIFFLIFFRFPIQEKRQNVYEDEWKSVG